MVKGVNKLIVDVANPDSEFFERVIFFVKPQKKDTPPKELNRNADIIIYEHSLNKRGTLRRKRKPPFPAGVAVAGAAGFGAAVSAILIKVMGF